jgi:hypothetical protein
VMTEIVKVRQKQAKLLPLAFAPQTGVK